MRRSVAALLLRVVVAAACVDFDEIRMIESAAGPGSLVHVVNDGLLEMQLFALARSMTRAPSTAQTVIVADCKTQNVGVWFADLPLGMDCSSARIKRVAGPNDSVATKLHKIADDAPGWHRTRACERWFGGTDTLWVGAGIFWSAISLCCFTGIHCFRLCRTRPKQS